MADMQELISRLEAAEGPDRALDREIGLRIDGWYETVDSHGECLMVNGDRYPDHPESEYPSFTESLDAALALAERVLPGWCVGVQPWFHTDPDRVMSRAYLIRPDWKRWNPVGDDWCDQHHGRSCATPALAVVAAILRAIQHGYEAAGEVSPILKAKAQGEGG